jgi:hypothetical protein
LDPLRQIRERTVAAKHFPFSTWNSVWQNRLESYLQKVVSKRAHDDRKKPRLLCNDQGRQAVEISQVQRFLVNRFDKPLYGMLFK